MPFFSFLIVVENVKKANEKELNLLHHLLYGREEPVSVFLCKSTKITLFNSFKSVLLFITHTYMNANVCV